MFLDTPLPPGHAFLAHVRRHPFLTLSVLLHAVPLAALAYLDHTGRLRIELAQRQQSFESGTRLTQQARLEKRVHDMQRIKSLLEQSTGAGSTQQEDEVQFSAQPRPPAALLEEARELARKIDDLEREAKAEQLAKLLDIPKEKAREQVAAPVKEEEQKQERPVEEAAPPADAAKQIEQLEAQARRALEQRRQQLERQRDGMPVAAGAGSGGARNPRDGNDTGAGQTGTGQGATGTKGLGPGTVGGAGSTVLDRIARFANPDLPDRQTGAYTEADHSDLYERGSGRIPDAGPAIVKGSGRTIGPGGAYANRIYVNRWYLIGPFDGRHGVEVFANVRHPPEQGVVLDAVYPGKGGRMLRWEYVNPARYPLIPAVQAEDAVYYGYTEVMLDKEQDLTIWVGADDDAQLWLNDRLVWRGEDPGKRWFFNQVYDMPNSGVRDYNLTEGKRVVRFRKGRNKLLFKLSNGPTRLFFSLVLTK